MDLKFLITHPLKLLQKNQLKLLQKNQLKLLHKNQLKPLHKNQLKLQLKFQHLPHQINVKCQEIMFKYVVKLILIGV
jgi:hypothetical protein